MLLPPLNIRYGWDGARSPRLEREDSLRVALYLHDGTRAGHHCGELCWAALAALQSRRLPGQAASMGRPVIHPSVELPS